MALLGVLDRRARWALAGPYRAILAALAFVSLAFAFGTIAYGLLYYGLPGINQLHSPFRWVFPLTLCLAALAGFGVEAIQQGERQPSPPDPLSPNHPRRDPSSRERGWG